MQRKREDPQAEATTPGALNEHYLVAHEVALS